MMVNNIYLFWGKSIKKLQKLTFYDLSCVSLVHHIDKGHL